MTRLEFWTAIESARKSARIAADLPAQLKNSLHQKPIDYIVGFEQQFHELDLAAYDARLWAAAFVMMDFCSDDKFMDFRSWLIAQGESVYEAALKDPDTLADLKQLDGDSGKPILFELRYVAEQIYRERLNDAIADIPLDSKKSILLNDDAWDGDHKKLSTMFPRLYAKYRGGA